MGVRMNKLAKGVVFALLALFLTACSGPSVKEAKDVITSHYQKLEQYWNEREYDEFLKLANETHFVKNLSQHRSQLYRLRRRIGKIRQSAPIIYDTDPSDSRAFITAKKVFTGRGGVFMIAIALNKELKIVGYRVSGRFNRSGY